MKTKSEMGLKAGINGRKENKFQKMRSTISKSASMLLIIMIGMSAMSFVQDSSFVSNRDTNKHVTRSKVVVVKNNAISANGSCCVAVVSDPGDNVKREMQISTPGIRAKYLSDRATILSFLTAVRDRKIWSLDRVTVTKVADREMQFNFLLYKLYPSAKMVAEADSKINENFINQMMGTLAFSRNLLYRADIEMSDGFIADHLSLAVIKPHDIKTVKADQEIIATFEAANRTVISVPSRAVAQKADQEMILY